MPIGLCEPLSGFQALSVLFPGTCLALFAVGSFVAALSDLGGGHLARAGVPGLITVVFSALLGRFLYDFVPQRAWLEGSVLTVERGGRQRQCNLASVEIIKLGSTMPPLTRGYSDAVPVLRARQKKDSELVRVVLRGGDLRLIPASQLLLLADAIESGPAPAPQAPKVCRRLRKLAGQQQPPPAWDWSFRTDPRTTGSAIDNDQH